MLIDLCLSKQIDSEALKVFIIHKYSYFVNFNYDYFVISDLNIKTNISLGLKYIHPRITCYYLSELAEKTMWK